MNCTNPEIGLLITLYEFDKLSESDRRKFEAHLLSCDTCFQSIYRLSPVIARMRENPQKFLRAFEPKKSVLGALKKKMVGTISDGLKAIGRIPLPVRIAIPSIAAVTVLLLVLLQPKTQLPNLARIEPLLYQPLKLKIGRSSSEADRLFNEGMGFYVQKDYLNAINKLTEAVQQNPENSNFHFYLGLCYLLSHQVDSAIEHLQKTIMLSGATEPETAYWFLGNAWLLKRESTKALQAFQKVVALEGDYEWQAEEIIAKIETLSRK